MSEWPVLQIVERDEDGRWRIAPTGELDLATVPQLKARLHDSIHNRPATVLDLSGLSFMDSSGIALLVASIGHARQNNHEFYVRDPSPTVRRTLQLSGLTNQLGLDSPTHDSTV